MPGKMWEKTREAEKLPLFLPGSTPFLYSPLQKPKPLKKKFVILNSFHDLKHKLRFHLFRQVQWCLLAKPNWLYSVALNLTISNIWLNLVPYFLPWYNVLSSFLGLHPITWPQSLLTSSPFFISSTSPLPHPHAGGWTLGLMHGRKVLYHWVISPASQSQTVLGESLVFQFFCLDPFTLNVFFQSHGFVYLCQHLPSLSHPRHLSKTSDIYSTVSWTSLFGHHKQFKTKLLIFLPQNPSVDSHCILNPPSQWPTKPPMIWPTICYWLFFYYALPWSHHSNHNGLTFPNCSRYFPTLRSCNDIIKNLHYFFVFFFCFQNLLLPNLHMAKFLTSYSSLLKCYLLNEADWNHPDSLPRSPTLLSYDIFSKAFIAF